MLGCTLSCSKPAGSEREQAGLQARCASDLHACAECALAYRAQRCASVLRGQCSRCLRRDLRSERARTALTAPSSVCVRVSAVPGFGSSPVCCTQRPRRRAGRAAPRHAVGQHAGRTTRALVPQLCVRVSAVFGSSRQCDVPNDHGAVRAVQHRGTRRAPAAPGHASYVPRAGQNFQRPRVCSVPAQCLDAVLGCCSPVAGCGDVVQKVGCTGTARNGAKMAGVLRSGHGMVER